MADEVETYLVHKLNEVIEGIRPSVKNNLFSNLWNIDTKITKLENLLGLKGNGPPRVSNRKEFLYNLNNILTHYQVRPKNETLSKNLDNILKKLDSGSRHPQAPGTADSNGEASQPPSHQESLIREPEDYRWSTRTVDPAKVHGFEGKVKTLQRQLVPQNADDSRFRAIGIVGMRGVGKTTLSQLIFCNEAVKNHFLPRIWVCVSKKGKEDEDKRKEIVKRMLICLGVEEDVIESFGHGLKGLLFALRLQLMGKRYLIILDDLWNTEEDMEDFCLDIAKELKCDEKLAYGLPKGRGGAVIVTSRTEQVVKGMVGEENLKSLEPLKEDRKSIWAIFKEAAEQNGKELTKELISLQERIVDKCAGLPLAAKMMGQIADAQISTGREQRQEQNSSQYDPALQTQPNPLVQNSSQYDPALETPPPPARKGVDEEDGAEGVIEDFDQ